MTPPHTQEVTIARSKLYPTPGTNYRVAWKWIYIVSSPGEFDAGATTLPQARRIAKARARMTGMPIVEAWRVSQPVR